MASELDWVLGTTAWSLAELWSLRDERLRLLLARAAKHSPWYREALAGVDISEVRGDDLTAIPVLTRADLENHWDDIVCDRALTKGRIEQHLERMAADGPSLLDDRYIVMLSGGSLGPPTHIVWTIDDFAAMVAAAARQYARERPRLRSTRPQLVRIHAESRVHATTVSSWISAGLSPAASVSSQTPLPIIVDRLNELRPTTLMAYASLLPLLAHEFDAGRLVVAPDSITSIGEAMDDASRAIVESVWCGDVRDVYSATESVIAQQRPGESGLHLVEDIAVYELVDEQKRPVPRFIRAASVLLTNVLNSTLPLIRYEVPDDPACLGSAESATAWPERKVLPPSGRRYPWFSYGDGVGIHTHAFEALIETIPGVADFQVTQTTEGLRLAVVARSGFDPTAAAEPLRRLLIDRGLADAQVIIDEVTAFRRTAIGGKTIRFLPI